jgi:2'-5' RNA ligase
MTFRLRS